MLFVIFIGNISVFIGNLFVSVRNLSCSSSCSRNLRGPCFAGTGAATAEPSYADAQFRLSVKHGVGSTQCRSQPPSPSPRPTDTLEEQP